ncbi:MAG: CpXC domain-containing protein, partial [Anaerolineae bacterium]|nr:CpXC domain-containing protein [Anaerolineae bacterium]
MSQPTQTTLQCSHCGAPNPVTLHRVIDVQSEPNAKAALLGGRLNAFQCQNCGQTNTVSTPLLYHDADKELLIAFVPMDVAMRQPGQNEEKIIGELMNELTKSLPKESFRAYMFNPKRALTMQGLIEQVMEADGVTPEMLAEQKQRVTLLQRLLEAQSEEVLLQLIQENDEAIDESFFQTLVLMAQRALQEGQQQVAGGLIGVQQLLLEHSTYGKELAQAQEEQEAVIQEVMQDINDLGDQPQRSDFLDLLLKYRDEPDRVQALVGLARPAMDYDFFVEFGEYISKAPADERDALETLRDEVRELTNAVDQQSRSVMQQKVQFLQILLNSADYEGMLRENMEIVDENFLAVLTANIQ